MWYEWVRGVLSPTNQTQTTCESDTWEGSKTTLVVVATFSFYKVYYKKSCCRLGDAMITISLFFFLLKLVSYDRIVFHSEIAIWDKESVRGCMTYLTNRVNKEYLLSYPPYLIAIVQNKQNVSKFQ